MPKSKRRRKSNIGLKRCASSLYHHPERRDFFSEEVKKLGLDPTKTTTFE
jgi:hypothetical protein